MSLKRSDLRRSATPTTTPAISAPLIALDKPLREGIAGSTHNAFSKKINNNGKYAKLPRQHEGVKVRCEGPYVVDEIMVGGRKHATKNTGGFGKFRYIRYLVRS